MEQQFHRMLYIPIQIMTFHLSLSLLCLCAAVWSHRLSLTEAIPCTSPGWYHCYLTGRCSLIVHLSSWTCSVDLLFCDFFSGSTISATVQQFLLDPVPTEPPTANCITASGTRTCTTPGVLFNNDVTLSDGNTFSWDQSSTVLVGFTISGASVYRANIYFRNEPSQGIGLPSVEAGYSFGNVLVPEDDLETTILSNQDLSQTDSGLRKISLVVTTDLHDFTQPFDNFFITFTFPDSSPVDSLVLSEVELCTDEGKKPALCINQK